jgi:hypothetical protein
VDASQPKAVRMAGSPLLENDDGTEVSDESFFSILDILLLGGLFVAAIWYLVKRSKREESIPTTKSYSIQYHFFFIILFEMLINSWLFFNILTFCFNVSLMFCKSSAYVRYLEVVLKNSTVKYHQV